VLATLHGNNSYHALNRILSFYPVEVRATMLGDLSSSLKAVVTQRLLRTPSGNRVPAVEVLLNTKLVSELIEKGDFSGVRDNMEKSMAEGSQTFEEDLARLIGNGTIDRNEGLANADSPTNLMWRLQNAPQNTIYSGAESLNPNTEQAAPPPPEFGALLLNIGLKT
jgi:twitching motility protein PilU